MERLFLASCKMPLSHKKLLLQLYGHMALHSNGLISNSGSVARALLARSTLTCTLSFRSTAFITKTKM